MKRLKYDRANINSTLDAARRIVQGTSETHYVYARAGGFNIEQRPDPFNQRGYRVTVANGIEKVGEW